MQIKRLDSGYLRAQGNGPCEWAQWPEHRKPIDSDFFPEASESFRRELARELQESSEDKQFAKDFMEVYGSAYLKDIYELAISLLVRRQQEIRLLAKTSARELQHKSSEEVQS